MSVAPGPSASRGEILIQPFYFTSTRFVHPFRHDIQQLVSAFTAQYTASPLTQPFTLFKSLWNAQGWPWMHFKVFDARTRDIFLSVSMRLFLERMVETEPPLTRVVALYALYTFYSTQPSSSAPPLHKVAHVPLSIDLYTSFVGLPKTLQTSDYLSLRPTAAYIVSTFVKGNTFHILPRSELFPFNPRELPRELFEHDMHASSIPVPGGVKKKGRPSKRDNIKRANDALGVLDKWLESNTASSSSENAVSTQSLLSRPPSTSREAYRTEKSRLLDAIDNTEDATAGAQTQQALQRANHAVLARLQKIDELAAEKGLEVGGEGGARTGLERVERAVGELDGARGRRGGILGLLEGGGME